MPWKECNAMDERLRFVAKLLDGEKMAVMCREFGISRKTGYKIFNRYKDFGIRGLEDRARSPYRHPNKTPFQIEKAILRINLAWEALAALEKFSPHWLPWFNKERKNSMSRATAVACISPLKKWLSLS